MKKTNIYDIGYIYFSTGIGFSKYMNRPIDNFFSKNCFLGCIDFVLKAIHSLFHSGFRFKKFPSAYNGVVAFGLSNNNRNTLMPIVRELGEEKVCSLFDSKDFPMWEVYFFAFPHLFSLIKEYHKAKAEDKQIIRYFFHKFWRMYGCRKVAERLIKHYHPKIILLANDHLEMNRTLMEVANEHDVKTLYVQHASVTDKFPPLHFSFSMLDGEDSFAKYKSAGDLKGEIYLCGGVRFDAIETSKNKETKAMGVAINSVDSQELVKRDSLLLKDRFGSSGWKVVLRPHPAMNQDFWRNWCDSNGIGFSCSTEESSFDFLGRLSFLVSNQSSIHLDAAMCHVPSVIYNMSKSVVKDHYGYSEKGLVPEARSINELCDVIDRAAEYRYDTQIVRYFNSSYNTPFEGKVAVMIASLIRDVLKGNSLEQFNMENGFKLWIGNNTFHVFSVNG